MCRSKHREEIFAILTPKAQIIKKLINSTSTKLKLWISKSIVKKLNWSHRLGEILITVVSDLYLEYIKKFYNSIKSMQIPNDSKNLDKDLHKSFTKEDINS